MITLTRKMFTMILSVVVYNHALTVGQWVGAGTVFAGIGVEAWVKRRGQCISRYVRGYLLRLYISHGRCTCQEGHTEEGKGANQAAIAFVARDPGDETSTKTMKSKGECHGQFGAVVVARVQGLDSCGLLACVLHSRQYFILIVVIYVGYS